jgi:hypothetical protein
VLHHQQQQQPHQQQQQQQQQLTARSRALQQAEDDPTQRSSWDAVPSYASHYAAEDQRPNMCKVRVARGPHTALARRQRRQGRQGC